jgi:HPt (histidine-containing phosphotransfer) domain-containing protein
MASESPANGAIDWEVAKRFTAGDAALLQELIDTAKEQTPRLLADLRKSQAESDLELLRRSSHTIKASANYFGARLLADAALAVEALARDQKLIEATQAIPALESEAARFVAALEARQSP